MSLDKIREQIEEIDVQILELIVNRMSLAQDVLSIKQKNGLTIDDPEQSQRVLKRATDYSVERGLDVKPVRDIFNILIVMNQERQHKLSGELGIG